MQLDDLITKKVAILGFGLEGQATAEYLTSKNVQPTILDQRTLSEFSDLEQKKLQAYETVLGKDYLNELQQFQFLFRSPGIWRLHPILLEAEKKGSVITSQMKWFFEHAQAPLIGVTGTKGKGTTSTLIYKILETGFPNKKVYLTGNVGKTQPFEILDQLTNDDLVVIELSSFQLQDLEQSPHIAVVLMTTTEHLDHHKNVEEYHEAKASIAKFQTSEDFCIINEDFEASREIGKLTPAKKLYFSRKRELTVGCFKLNSALALRGLKNAGLFVPDDNAFLETNQLKLRGEHNLENVAASVLAALALGVEKESILKTIYDFSGLEHRLELVGTVEGITFYNDSFSTVPETAIAAIKAFSEPEILILGGSEKYSDFTELGKVIAQSPNIKSIILVGVTAFRIKEALISAGYKNQLLEGAQSMPEIFEKIKAVATKGDVVVLSPACASFGMFKNYKDRGQQFKDEVRKWGGA